MTRDSRPVAPRSQLGTAVWNPSPVLLGYALGSVFVGALAFMALIRIVTPEQNLRYFGPGMGAVVALISWLYLKSGKINTSIQVFALGLWSMTTAIMVAQGGLQTPIVIAYPVLTMLIAWLFGARAGFLTAGISTVTILFVLFALANGWLPAPPRTPTAMYAVIQIVVIWVSAILINALIRSYRNQLRELEKTGNNLTEQTLELQATQDKLHVAIEATQMLFWNLEIETDKFDYDTAKLSWIGLEYANPPRSMADWIDLIHPADQQQFRQHLRDVVDSRSNVLDCDYRITDAANGWIWLHTRGMVVLRDHEGKPAQLGGGCINVTERKRAEEKLVLSAMALESSSEALLITDASNRIQEVNSAFTRITGYERSEVIDTKPTILGDDQGDLPSHHAMLMAVEETGQWQGEMWSRRKNGDLFAQWLTINTLFNDDHTIHRRVALFSDITDKKKADEQIQIQANYDVLTQLPNRRMFQDRLAQAIKSAQRSKLPVALLFLDLDNFKDINDILGHTRGDTLLIEAAQRILKCVRNSDTVSRMGGDEFTVILTELDNVHSVERVAQSIVDALALPFMIETNEVTLSVSMGITLWPDDTADMEELVRNADQAMYAAKSEGRGRYRYFTPALQAAAKMRVQVLADLRKALEEGQFVLHFQPIVHLSTGRIQKAEALLRWQHPVQGLIGPGTFIALAEESGMINEIGHRVFVEAAKQVKLWQQAFGADFQISVNVSPIQMRATDLSKKWLPVLDAMGLEGHSIVIEITESLLLDDSGEIAAQLQAFREAGVQLAIDDFGTGYSSLSYVQKLDFDYLKIDQSFVRNLETAANDRALSESMVLMAHKLGLRVVAEGVETTGQRTLLEQMGSDYGQGYLFSRPLSAPAFEALMATSQKVQR